MRVARAGQASAGGHAHGPGRYARIPGRTGERGRRVVDLPRVRWGRAVDLPRVRRDRAVDLPEIAHGADLREIVGIPRATPSGGCGGCMEDEAQRMLGGRAAHGRSTRELSDLSE